MCATFEDLNEITIGVEMIKRCIFQKVHLFHHHKAHIFLTSFYIQIKIDLGREEYLDWIALPQ